MHSENLGCEGNWGKRIGRVKVGCLLFFYLLCALTGFVGLTMGKIYNRPGRIFRDSGLLIIMGLGCKG